ncbi:hypothetical protein [Paenibacillus eucommiae]|uniref:Uncharacterized protein n=1 Tax=Paenibacillus eucommiae TaxID=1355755 RepID=A0ABS4J5X9_9BACL|nr:hypothetical protein [Paenibacillus eucommiae]MBP1995256.1 hypothetical protein [Paenibacillus eucommiae]
MFDPTIYENLKVVLEGAVYDMDLEGAILVTKRTDRIELSSMSRYYAIEFTQPSCAANKAQISLEVHLRDLAAEILENANEKPGCTMEVILSTVVDDPILECALIEKEIEVIWQKRPIITQTLSFDFNEQPVRYFNQIKLHFGRKVDEGQIDDFPELIRYAMKSLIWLNQRKR